MAVKSVIDIEINDGAFSRFSAMFKQYQTLLAKTPQSWQQAQASIDGSRKSFQQLVAASAVQQSQSRLMAAAQREAARQLDAQSRTWRDIGRSTKTAAGNILDMTRQLMRWASLTGVFSGILGAGGLFGIERLAHSASAMRTSSMGLGVSPGQQRAFNLNYGRIIPNSGGLMSAVNAALTDPRQSASLAAAGLTAQDTRGRNTAEVSVTLIDKIKQLADTTERGMLGGVHQSRGLGQFITLEDFQRLKDTPRGEMAGVRQRFLQDVKTLDLTKDQQTAWQRLSIQLERVAGQIETSLMKALVRLAPEIEKLSDSFGDMVRELLESGAAEEGIKKFASGLKWIGDKISDPKFQASVTNFISAVGRLTEKTVSFADWLLGDKGKDSPSRADKPTPPSSSEPAAPKTGSPSDIRRLFKLFIDLFPTPPSMGGTPMSGILSFGSLTHWAAYRPMTGGTLPPGLLPSTGSSRGPAFFGQLEGREGLPGGLLDAVWNQESRRGRNMGPSSAGALGHFQFMPGTARRFGLQDPSNLQESASAASRYLGLLLRRYGGDIGKAAAGYNWGEGNLDRAIRKYGEGWMSHAPRETQGYVRSILNQLGIGQQQPGTGRGGGGTWAVNIFNNTGGNAIVTAAQLPA